VGKRKRVSGEGTYKKRKDGRWEAQYTIHTLSGTKRKSVYGRTKQEVAEKLRKAIAERDGGLAFDAENLTLAEYIKRWLADSVHGSVARSTFERYEQLCRLHIGPAIGGVELKKLTPVHIQGLYRAKLDEGLGLRSVEYIHTTLNKALKQAVKWQLVSRNVAEAVTAPRSRKREMLTLDCEQTRRLLSTAKGDRLEALYVLAATAGLRQGELLGLRWTDINLETGTLTVKRSLRYEKDGPYYTEGKRDRSRRRVELGPSTVTTIKAHRKRQNEERLAYEGLWEDHDLIFPDEHGRPMRARNLNRYFQKLLQHANLEEVGLTFNGLRHTCATLMLLRDVPVKVVSERLGHADVALTLRVYSHVLPGMQKNAADGLDEMLF
jgi:integrase